MNQKITIACLPVAGLENPYQSLMIQGLNADASIEAKNGFKGRFFGIFKTVYKQRPDVVHFDWITSYYERRRLWMTLVLLPLFYAQVLYVRYFTATKIVWTLHNIDPHNAQNLWLHRIVRRFFARQCLWIRVFSEDSIERAKAVLKQPIEKFLVIPEGPYTEVYPNEISRQEARRKLELPHANRVLLSLGFIKPYKGFENLMMTFAKLNPVNTSLVIAGNCLDEGYKKQLDALLNEYPQVDIRLMARFIPPEELQYYFNAADAVVLPFDKVENSGSVIMAMGFKKAILAPQMGVLKKRLAQQNFLLYNRLEEGLNTIFAIDQNELETIGQKNYASLQQHRWEDFVLAFK
ncbi:glycosyltransferase [Flavobacteriaceae bacterium F08102]|nr:glycosyltransferase [Flavobacteriaceae bacterium F08102]